LKQVVEDRKKSKFFYFRMQLFTLSPLFKAKSTMKNIRIIVLAMVSGGLLSSCDWNNNQTIVGTGDVMSMEVEVPDFEGVSVTGTCDVDIVIGETQSVELHAQQEILEHMSYEVKNHILYIGFKPGYTVNTSKEISASIVIPTVSHVSITGAADFELAGEKQEVLDIHITGTGNVSAFDMEVNDCTIRISGAGNCEVNVAAMLDVLISGVGNVFYMGDPAVTSEVSGVGHVSPVTP
jgi:hypothetical protein